MIEAENSVTKSSLTLGEFEITLHNHLKIAEINGLGITFTPKEWEIFSALVQTDQPISARNLGEAFPALKPAGLRARVDQLKDKLCYYLSKDLIFFKRGQYYFFIHPNDPHD